MCLWISTSLIQGISQISSLTSPKIVATSSRDKLDCSLVERVESADHPEKEISNLFFFFFFFFLLSTFLVVYLSLFSRTILFVLLKFRVSNHSLLIRYEIISLSRPCYYTSFSQFLKVNRIASLERKLLFKSA